MLMLMLVLMLMSKCEPALMGTLKGPAISIVTKQKKSACGIAARNLIFCDIAGIAR